MAIKVGISGFGRIGRVVIRAMANHPEIDLVGVNYRNADLDYLVYMLKYDSAFGRFDGTVERYEEGLVINGKKVRVFSEPQVIDIPWEECGAEYIIESTGAYTTTEKAMDHIKAGAKKVIISAPAKDAETPMFVYGVNHKDYTKDMKIVSNASCTTNCLAPVCKVLEDNFGIEQGLMATIHASTSKQKSVDMRSMKDWRVGRSVYDNIIPTTTGAAKAVGKVIPSLNGKMTGLSYRIPAPTGSLVDLNVITKKATSYEEICKAMKEAAEGELKGVLMYSEEELVSVDVVGQPITSVFDSKMGIEMGENFFKVVSFYDNEFGYSNQILNMLEHMYSVDHE